MSEIFEFLRVAGLFVGGLLIRFLLLALVLAAYAVPILVALGVYRAWKTARERRVGEADVRGLRLVEGLSYTSGHLWVDRKAFGRLRVGMDDLAQRLFPDVTQVWLPRVGTVLAKGEPAVTIKSEPGAASIPSPVDGVVTAVNAEVAANPGLLQQSPYSGGWLFAVKARERSVPSTRTGSEARSWFRQEEERLSHLLEAELGMAAADGGELIVPASSLLPKDRWQKLVSEFLQVS